jgi:hypothetical protein
MWPWFTCAPPEPPEGVVTTPAAVRAVVEREDVRLEAATRVLGGREPEVRLVGAVHVGDPAFYGSIESFVAPCATVMYEGLSVDPDAPPPDDEDVGDALAAVGLAFQRDALQADDRWVRTDLSVPEMKQALTSRPDTTAEQVDAWLVDRDRDALREVLAAGATDGRLRGVVRLSLIRGLARPPPDDDGYREVLLGARDAHVVEAVTAARVGPVCVVYGADHLPDLEARLLRRGWSVRERGALPVITVPLGEVGLGPVQARQLLAR